MRKDRLAYFKKQLVEKQRQLTEEVGRTALYGKDPEDDSIKDLGDQANTATREILLRAGQRRPPSAARRRLGAPEAGRRGFGRASGAASRSPRSGSRRYRSRAIASTASG